MTRDPVWTLDTGLSLVRILERVLPRYGWHVALTGSVLRKGYSDKDLDLVVYPRKKRGKRLDRGAMRRGLRHAGLHPVRTRAWMLRNWASRGIHDRKWVEVWGTKDARRIDVMVLS